MAGTDSLEGSFQIKPATPVPAEKTILPPCDQVGITIIIPRVACFRRDPNVLSEEQFVAALKVAVANTIAEYPHLCGKITYANKATGRIQLEIPEDTSVQLVIKRQAHLSADVLEPLRWPPAMLKRAELTLSKYPTRGINTYNFAVQANLIENGVLLVIHMNHIHFDGIGHVMIEMVLAHHLSRALDGKKPRPSGIITKQALDKSLAWGKKPARPILEWEDWRKAGPGFQMPEGSTDDDLMEMLINASQDFTMSLWQFTPEAQKRLRDKIQPPNGKKLSLASCMHSFMWRTFVRAREHEPDVVSTCFTPVQTRGRVKDLPQMWSGSALVYSRAKATADEVLKLPLWELGSRIEAGTARWTEETVREYWGSIEECPNLADVEPNVNRVRGTDVEFSNVTTFPFYSLNWGKGLQVKGWRTTELAFSDAYVLLAPRLPDGTIEVMILWTEECLERAVQDPDWREFAQFVNAGSAETDKLIRDSGVPCAFDPEKVLKPKAKL